MEVGLGAKSLLTARGKRGRFIVPRVLLALLWKFFFSLRIRLHVREKFLKLILWCFFLTLSSLVDGVAVLSFI